MKKKLNYDVYKKLEEKYKCYVDKIASVRLILFLVLIVSFILKYYYVPMFWSGMFLVSLILFVIFVLIHDYYYKFYDYYAKYVLVLDTYLERGNGKWKEFSDTGADFIQNIQNDQAYLQDLDILGNCSLFQYLSICRTLGGREKLVERLSNRKVSSKQLKLDQEAIQELAKNVDFVVDFQVSLSKYDQKKVHLSRDFSSFQKGIGSRTLDIGIAIICSAICLIFLFLGCFHILPFQYFYGMFFFNFIMSLAYKTIFLNEFRFVTRFTKNYGGLKNIISSVVKREFSSSLLNDFKKYMTHGMQSIHKLGKIDTLNSLSTNFIASFVFNGLFCNNLILLYQFSKFLSSSMEGLKDSVESVEELEAMISLASLGIVRKQSCIPTLSDKIEISFDEMKHPLLDEEICVPNDLDSVAGVHIITGSNMGGKTSFLRTIGINMILMNAGGYVCANSFRAHYFKIFTSMRVMDDIEKGISTFYGELLRIKEAIDYVEQGPMLVFIDEIFKGTNYQDRMYGAKEVIKRLNTKNTITFITTHDFELCEEEHVVNYHVKEYYENDQIFFDYKIRKGQCSSTNAKYLMKKLGILK